MDIAGLSMSLASAKTQTAWGIAMMDNTLDLSKQTGDAMVEMISAADMERSVNPHVGGNVDLFI